MLAADQTGLEGLVTDQLSYTHSGGVVESKAQFVNVIVSKKTIYKSIRLSEPSVVIVGNNEHHCPPHLLGRDRERRQGELRACRSAAGLAEAGRSLEIVSSAGVQFADLISGQWGPSRVLGKPRRNPPRVQEFVHRGRADQLEGTDTAPSDRRF